MEIQSEKGDRYSSRGRDIYGPTEPSKAIPCERTTPLSASEIAEVVDIIATGRIERRSRELPEGLRTRDWRSVEQVIIALDRRLGREGSGWKVGAASREIRVAEGLPSPCPGRIYQGTIFDTPAELPPELFINYRNCECEFAFIMGREYAPQKMTYKESDVRMGIESLVPVIEIGDMVFKDWYGASSYFGSCLDNGGGAALVKGPVVKDWKRYDEKLSMMKMDLYLNDTYIKSGVGKAAMEHPITSLTWLINWVTSHGISIRSGEIISTGTCTGHLFAAAGDIVTARFRELGDVVAHFD
jgi:2-keto-4-pentenoate hydratase